MTNLLLLNPYIPLVHKSNKEHSLFCASPNKNPTTFLHILSVHSEWNQLQSQKSWSNHRLASLSFNHWKGSHVNERIFLKYRQRVQIGESLEVRRELQHSLSEPRFLSLPFLSSISAPFSHPPHPQYVQAQISFHFKSQRNPLFLTVLFSVFFLAPPHPFYTHCHLQHSWAQIPLIKRQGNPLPFFTAPFSIYPHPFSSSSSTYLSPNFICSISAPFFYPDPNLI